jgi:hypothetical protein
MHFEWPNGLSQVQHFASAPSAGGAGGPGLGGDDISTQYMGRCIEHREPTVLVVLIVVYRALPILSFILAVTDITNAAKHDTLEPSKDKSE